MAFDHPSFSGVSVVAEPNRLQLLGERRPTDSTPRDLQGAWEYISGNRLCVFLGVRSLLMEFGSTKETGSMSPIGILRQSSRALATL
jgi:hypothetical protein